MKKKNDLKKLALMGMATGMLLSNSQVEATFGNDETAMNALAYVAAKCGNKCGGKVAASCSGHGSCNGQVADRTPYGYYYQSSCGGQHFDGYSGYQGQGSHGCGGASTQPGYSSHGCGGNAQGYYDPSHWSASQSQTQTQAQQQPQQWQQQQQASSKFQASNGCGGSHSCNQGPDNGGRFQSGNSVNNSSQGHIAEADAHVVAPQLNEGDLLSKLNAQGKATYNGLTPEGKKLALQLANQDCKGKNDCKGLNSCKTDKNDCAGKGGCKGTAKAPFADKNVAVKVAAAKMAEKRNGLQNKNGK